MKLKIILFVCSLFIVTERINAQAAIVNDPAMLEATVSNWSMQLRQAQQQFDEIKEQSKFLQESIDKYKKVNTVIKQSKQVKQLIDKQVNLISMLSNEMSSAGSSAFDLKIAESYKNRLLVIMEASKDNIENLTDLLIDSRLNLSDYERLKLLEDMDEKSSKLVRALQRQKEEFESLNSNLRELERLKTVK